MTEPIHKTRCPLCGWGNLWILKSGVSCTACHRTVVLRRDASGGNVSADTGTPSPRGRRGLSLLEEVA